MKIWIKWGCLLLICFFVLAHTDLAQTASELTIRAKSAIEKRDFAAAISDATAAIKLDASNADAFFWRAYAYKTQKDYVNALADVNESIRLKPQQYLAFGLRGDIYFKQKEIDSAITDYSKSVELNQKYPTGFYNRAIAYENKAMPDWVAAQSDFTRYIELNPQAGDGHYQRGYVDMKLNQIAAAEADYVAAANLGVNTDDLYVSLTYVNVLLGHFVEATLNARQALEINPNNKDAQSNLNHALAKREKPFDAALTIELRDAAVADNVQQAITALNRGAQVNSTFTYYDTKSSSALQRAAQNGNYALAKALISVGADVNLADANGLTPLQYATTFYKTAPNRLEIIKLLIKNGADVNQANSLGETVLHQVANMQGNDQALAGIEILVKAGAKLEQRTNGNSTPLIYAAKGGTTSGVRALLAAGSDPNVVNDNGDTPLIYAVRSKGFGLTKDWLLLRAGAKPALPSDEKTKGYESVIEAVKLMAALPKGSPETKLFDAVADDNAQELATRLAAMPSVNSDILNYLLLMSVWNDNPAMLQGLIAKGADPNYKMGDDNALQIAKIQRKNNASNYLSNYSIAPVQTDSTAKNEQRIAELIDKAGSSLAASNNYFREAIELKTAGRDKGIYCVRVRDAAQEASYSLKFIKDAEAIVSLEWGQTIKKQKELAIKHLASLTNLGCPIILRQ